MCSKELSKQSSEVFSCLELDYISLVKQQSITFPREVAENKETQSVSELLHSHEGVREVTKCDKISQLEVASLKS